MQKEIAKLDAIRQRLEQKIDKTSPQQIRNIAVDNSPLKDDRGTDAEQLYKDAERLAQELKNGQKSNAFEEKFNDDAVDLGGGKNGVGKTESVYKGPSVLSFKLEGRKGAHLPTPAYKGYSGGDVKVTIIVNRQGVVIQAIVVEEESSTNKLLRKFALEAALKSRFSKSSTAPEPQTGEIVYRFVAQ